MNRLKMKYIKTFEFINESSSRVNITGLDSEEIKDLKKWGGVKVMGPGVYFTFLDKYKDEILSYLNGIDSAEFDRSLFETVIEEDKLKSLVNETYELLEGSVSYEDLNDILNEGIFSFIKGIFMNPGQKRKLRKLGDQLFKIKVQIQKMDIEQNDISKAEDELKSKDSNYTADPALSVAVNAEEKKKQALQNKEGIVIDQMDSVAGQNETLTKYVNKVKLEVRMKANEATIKLADDEMERILRKIQKKDAKEVQTLDKVLAKAA